jgi:putative hemolysin
MQKEKQMSTASARKLRKLTVRIAENQLEIEKALSLRFNVFNQEMGEGLPQSAATGKDRDEYDLSCDHLVVVDEERGSEVVGTYRLLTKSRALENIGFYSAREFDLSNIYELPYEIAEVGRSCVHPEYRDGSVISLLWAGIAGYIQQNQIRVLMGCGSLHSTDPAEVNEVFAYLKAEGHLVEDNLRVYPTDAYVHPGFRDIPLELDRKIVARRLPPLIKGYMRIGAKIGGVPALDTEFGTTDLFIYFDAKGITDRYGKRFDL